MVHIHFYYFCGEKGGKEAVASSASVPVLFFVWTFNCNTWTRSSTEHLIFELNRWVGVMCDILWTVWRSSQPSCHPCSGRIQSLLSQAFLTSSVIKEEKNNEKLWIHLCISFLTITASVRGQYRSSGWKTQHIRGEKTAATLVQTSSIPVSSR